MHLRYMNFFKISFTFLFVFGIMLGAFSSDAYAVSDRCPRHQVKTFLKAKKKKTRFQRASLNDINGYLNTHNVLAFVYNPIDLERSYDFDFKDIGNNRVCVLLKSVKVNYISYPQIVMPKDFKRNSCEYKIILKHEKRHLKVHYDYFERSVPEYKAFLGRVARRVPLSKPVSSAEELEEMKAHIVDYFDSELSDHISTSRSRMQDLQSKIDTDQEYLFGIGRKMDRCKLEEERKKQNKKTFNEHSHK